MSTDTRNWLHAFPLAELAPGSSWAFKLGGRQIAIFHRSEGTLYASDNRCPHEGYPLARGRFFGESVLMCIWHSFAFNLEDGRCLAGDEDLAVYPVRVVDGEIEVDVVKTDLAASIRQRFESLNEGLRVGSMGQVVRDVVRLLEAGVSAEQLVGFAVSFDSRYAPYGSTHALPLAADTLRMLPRYSDVQAIRPLAQLFDMAGELLSSQAAPTGDSARKLRERPEAIDPGDEPVAAGERLREAAEALRIAEAEGLLRGAIAKGWGRAEIEPWLFRLCTDHFIAFGHGLIYQTKVFDMLDQLGWQHADEILGAHLFPIVFGAREERIPNHSAFLRALPRIDSELVRWYEAAGAREVSASQETSLSLALLEGGTDEALDALAGCLNAGVAPAALVRVLSLAASERILRFDPAIEADPTVQEGWLDVTHTLTTASATRLALERFDHPDALRTLFQLAYFIQRSRPLDSDKPPETAVARGATLEQVLAAVGDHRPDEAVSTTAGYLADGGETDELCHGLQDLIFADHAVLPIFVTHMLKTLLAARDEYEALGDHPERQRPLLAAVRFLAAPQSEHRLASAIEDALRFVVDAKTPRRLTP
ncbi:MAG: Rieske (2Fe-2S) protein [Candidatus Poseidoniia archaeon]